MSKIKDYEERQDEADKLRPIFPPEGEISTIHARVNHDGNIEIWNEANKTVVLEDRKDIQRLAWWLDYILSD